MTGSPKLPNNSGGRECPICGKRTYSAGGMHPQCAVVQMDQEIKKELKKKEKEASKKTNTDSDKNSRWKKSCPSCHLEVHVRLKKCQCGHEF